MKLLCAIGIHIPKKETVAFIDKVDGREVFKGHCACGIEWLHNCTMKTKPSD